MYKNKYEVLDDLTILIRYDTLIEHGIDYYNDKCYLKFFNDCIKKYELGIDELDDISEIYVDNYDFNYYSLLEDTLRVIIVND